MRSVNLGRWSRRVERYFNMKGGGGLVDVEQSLRMVLPFASGVEERYLEGWNRFAIVANVAAVAAKFSAVQIRNPAGSNVIAVVEQLTVDSSVADTPFVTWGATTTDLATIVSLTFTRMDPRGSPQPTNVVSFTQQTVSTGTPFLQRGVAAALSQDFLTTHDQQIPILPGQSVYTQALAANTTLLVSLMWRERALEASELT